MERHGEGVEFHPPPHDRHHQKEHKRLRKPQRPPSKTQILNEANELLEMMRHNAPRHSDSASTRTTSTSKGYEK